MGKGVFTKVLLLVNLIVFINCDVSDVRDVASEESLIPGTPLANVTNDFSIQVPEKFIVFMDRENDYMLNFSIPCRQTGKLVIEFKSKHSYVFVIAGNTSYEVECLSDNNKTNNYGEEFNIPQQTQYINGSAKVQMLGRKLGIADLIVSVRLEASSSHVTSVHNVTDLAYASQVFPVAVLRYIRVLDKVFLAVVPFIIVVVMIGFGCKLDLDVVKECFRKPLAPGIGFGCQYVIMPLLGFTIAKLVPTGDQGVSLGIFLCGICPGGGISNIYTLLLDGDVSLSITMTFVSSVAAIGMMPLWIYTLGRVFTNEMDDLKIPYIDLLQITAIVAVPLMIGVFLKFKCQKVAKIFTKILKPVTIICILFVITVGIYSNLYLFKMFQPIHFVAGCLLPYLGYALGGVISTMFRLPWARVRTIAIETGLQNVGVAYILLMKSFPPPYGDIAALAPASSGLMTPLPLLLITIVYLIYKRCTRKYEPVEQKADINNKNKEIALMDGENITLEKLSSV